MERIGSEEMNESHRMYISIVLEILILLIASVSICGMYSAHKNMKVLITRSILSSHFCTRCSPHFILSCYTHTSRTICLPC
jgi:hypothetical protein